MTHYAQGCDGGFGYLVAKWAADFTIVANKGFPYESGLSDSFGPPCSKKCRDCEQDKYRAQEAPGANQPKDLPTFLKELYVTLQRDQPEQAKQRGVSTYFRDRFHRASDREHREDLERRRRERLQRRQLWRRRRHPRRQGPGRIS